MIPWPGCPLWPPDLPGPAGASAMSTVSYTTSWDTILPSGSGVVIAHEDVTQLVLAEKELAELERRLMHGEQYSVAVQETEHRAKNLLAVVLAIARQTALRHVPRPS